MFHYKNSPYASVRGVFQPDSSLVILNLLTYWQTFLPQSSVLANVAEATEEDGNLILIFFFFFIIAHL